jgi:hypothetical protein
MVAVAVAGEPPVADGVVVLLDELQAAAMVAAVAATAVSTSQRRQPRRLGVPAIILCLPVLICV